MLKIKPQFIVIIGVLFISFSSIFVRLADAPSLMIALYRMLFTVALLLPFLLKSGTTKELQTVGMRHFMLSICSGVFLALHFYSFMASLNYTSVTSSTVLVTIHPIFVGIGSYFFLKEKMTARFFKAVGITLLGGIIISVSDSGHGSSALFGDMLAFIGALFMTGYMIIGRVVRQNISVTSYTFLVYSSSTVTLLIINAFLKYPFFTYSSKDYLLFFAMAFICTILGHNVLNWALKYLNPTYISTAILGEPVFATFWAILLFNEVPSVYQFFGSSIVILGLVYMIRTMDR